MRDYVEFMRRHRKSADDTEGKLDAYVLSSPLAGKRLADLAPADFENWLAQALKRQRRTRQNAAPPTLREMIAAGLNTGCRAGELLSLRTGDCDVRSITLLIADSKSGKPEFGWPQRSTP